MTFPDLNVVVSIGTLASILVGFAWTRFKVIQAEATIQRLRENDLHDLTARLDRIENKLDQHLLAHAK